MATLASTTRSTTITLASASAGPFEVGFRLFGGELSVYLDGIETFAYSLTAVFDDGYGYCDTATITLSSAAASGTIIAIHSDLPFGRGEDYLPGDPGLVRKLNIELARRASVDGDIIRDLIRAPKYRPGGPTNVEFPNSPNVLLGIDGSGNLVGYPQTEGAVAAVIVFQGSFVGNNTAGPYGLTGDPRLAQFIDVYVDGVRQRPTTDYSIIDVTVSETAPYGKALQFTEALATGLDCDYLGMGPTSSTVSVLSDVEATSGLNAQQEIDRRGITFASRAAAIAASIPADMQTISVFHGGHLLHYVRDGVGTALTTADGATWSPPLDQITVLHWGADNGCTMSTPGIVTGTDCTAQAQAMVDWVIVKSTTASASRKASPRIAWGAGAFRISGSVNFTAFSAGLARVVEIDLTGATLYGDNAGKPMLDFTDAESFRLINGHIVGSPDLALAPLCAVKLGRPANNDSAGFWAIKGMNTRGTNTLKSTFLLAAVWNVGSEVTNERHNQWYNGRSDGAGYGAAYDTCNTAGYAQPQLIGSLTSANPGVFTIAGHGYTNGQVLVATDLSVNTLVNIGSMDSLEGTAWTVANATTNTFTLTNASGAFNGTGYSLTTSGARTGRVMAFCREIYRPSLYIGDRRLEPFKRHSGLQIQRDSCQYYGENAKAALMQGTVSALVMTKCFATGPIGIHFVSTLNNALDNLHWDACLFDVHVEVGSGGSGFPAAWSLHEALLPAYNTEQVFNNCNFIETGMNAEYAVKRVGSTTVRFFAGDWHVHRLVAASAVSFTDAPTAVKIQSGYFGVQDAAYITTDLSAPLTELTADVADYSLATEDLYMPPLKVVTDFDAIAATGFYINPVGTTGAPGLLTNWMVHHFQTGTGARRQIGYRLNRALTRAHDGVSWGAWEGLGRQHGVLTVSTDAAATVTWGTQGPSVLHTATLTADRNLTLNGPSSGYGLTTGSVCKVTRTGAGAFNVVVRDGVAPSTLKNLATNQWCEATFNGTNWVLTQFGSL